MFDTVAVQLLITERCNCQKKTTDTATAPGSMRAGKQLADCAAENYVSPSAADY